MFQPFSRASWIGSTDSAHEDVHPSAHDVVIIGAGPAGLTAAYELSKLGEASTVIEADTVVGGISRSAERDGWRFDIGGHRFFTKVRDVERVWHEILPPEDFLLRPRMSRIYYNGKFFDYPLRAVNALRGLGVIEATRCVLSYMWARIRPPKDRESFEGWTVSRFGWRLYRTFFKTYTEKVWGVPATEIKADWAAQRIKNLSLSKAVLNAILPKRNQKDITSLIEEFEYPKYGPGMMWERCRDIVEARGTKVLMSSRVVAVHQWRPRRSRWGELVQWDTSDHDWLEGRGEQIYLISMIDDASSRLLARFVRHDSSEENMRLLWAYLERFGRPLAFYTDKAGMFQVAVKTKRQEQREGRDRPQMPPTQIERALRELHLALADRL